VVGLRQYDQYTQCTFTVILRIENSFRINDISVLKDFMAETFASGTKLEVLTVENAPATIGHCL